MDANDLTPESRMFEGATGTPLILADGREWLLADGGLLNVLDDLRDRIDDESRLKGEVTMLEVAEVAGHLLLANYALSVPEARALLTDLPAQDLADAVREALYGSIDGSRTYTTWAASALLANGIDPASVPGHLRPHVLYQLEATGRCVPRQKYIDSAIAAGRFAHARAMIRPTPAVPEPTPIVPQPQPTEVS